MVLAGTLCLHSKPLPLAFPKLSPGYFISTKSPAAQQWDGAWSRVSILYWLCTVISKSKYVSKSYEKSMRHTAELKSSITEYIHVAIIFTRNLGNASLQAQKYWKRMACNGSLSIRSKTLVSPVDRSLASFFYSFKQLLSPPPQREASDAFAILIAWDVGHRL